MSVEAFDVVDLIRTKRDKGALSTEQINWLVDAYTRGYVADEQMSAMTMAIFLNGMQREEIRDLTLAMIASGETLSFDGLGKPTTDKHSTGGVGDKITLPSRRSLRHSGSLFRSSPGADSATPGARSTSSSASPGGGPRFPRTR